MTSRKSFIIVLFIIGFFVIIAFYNQRQVNNLKNNHEITLGQITKFYRHLKQTSRYDYNFFVGKEKYSGSYTVVECHNEFVNKKFPVIYNPSDPTKNEMLIFYSDFEKYSEVYPDSINWANKYR